MSNTSALRQAARIRILGKYTGQLGMVVAALAVPPMVVCWLSGDGERALRFLIVAGALAGVGYLLGRLPGGRVQPNEGMLVTALAFLMASLVMAWPLADTRLPFVDALFESVSGVTTTGLSVSGSVDDRGIGFHFARAWLQWFGGLGIVALSVALVYQPGPASIGLSAASSEDRAGSTRAHARRVFGVYAVLTAMGIGLLWLLGAGFGDAILYTLAAVSTGGFAPHDDSLLALPHAARWGVTVICMLGAVPLLLWLRTREQPHMTFQTLWVCLLGVAGIVLVGAHLHFGQGWQLADAANTAGLLALSAQTTAGFSATDVGQLDGAAKALVMFGMFLGGGVGSTAGGIKVLRLLILFRVLETLLARTALPHHAYAKPTLARRRLGPREIRLALIVILLFAGTVALSWVPFLVHDYDPLDSLFDVVSAVGTVGLSTGVTSQDLPAFLKLVLCADMLLGRLEILAWLVLLYPGTWIGRRREVERRSPS